MPQSQTSGDIILVHKIIIIILIMIFLFFFEFGNVNNTNNDFPIFDFKAAITALTYLRKNHQPSNDTAESTFTRFNLTVPRMYSGSSASSFASIRIARSTTRLVT